LKKHAKITSKTHVFPFGNLVIVLPMETQEGKTMRLSAGQGSAMLNCEGYTKDREEYDLDQDIERNMGGREWLDGGVNFF